MDATVQQSPGLRPQRSLKQEVPSSSPVPCLQAVGVALRCSGDTQTRQVEASVRGAPGSFPGPEAQAAKG